MGGAIGRFLKKGIVTAALSLLIVAAPATAALADGPDLPPSTVEKISEMLGKDTPRVVPAAPASSEPGGGTNLVPVIALTAGVILLTAGAAFTATARHNRRRVASSG